MPGGKTRIPRWAAFIGFLSVLGVLAPITGDDRWLWFGLLLCVPTITTLRYDERMANNVARAGRNGFFVSLAGLVLLMVLTALRLPMETISGTLAGLWVLLFLCFMGSLLYYERRGL